LRSVAHAECSFASNKCAKAQRAQACKKKTQKTSSVDQYDAEADAADALSASFNFGTCSLAEVGTQTFQNRLGSVNFGASPRSVSLESHHDMNSIAIKKRHPRRFWNTLRRSGFGNGLLPVLPEFIKVVRVNDTVRSEVPQLPRVWTAQPVLGQLVSTCHIQSLA
jgi:hypothetical protein